MSFLQSAACFFIYGFLGWLYESIFYTVQFRKPVNTGFLKGCFCPIYGVVCVINALILGREHKSWVIFLVSMILVSCTEYIVSAFLEAVFGKRWWDYSDWPCNINGRISLLSSVGFGILSLIQIKFIQPSLMRWITIIPDKWLYAGVMIFIVLLFMDIVYSLRKIDDIGEKPWFVEEEFEVIQKAGDKLNDVRENASLKYTDVKTKIKDRMGKR